MPAVPEYTGLPIQVPQTRAIDDAVLRGRESLFQSTRESRLAARQRYRQRIKARPDEDTDFKFKAPTQGEDEFNRGIKTEMSDKYADDEGLERLQTNLKDILPDLDTIPGGVMVPETAYGQNQIVRDDLARAIGGKLKRTDPVDAADADEIKPVPKLLSQDEVTARRQARRLARRQARQARRQARQQAQEQTEAQENEGGDVMNDDAVADDAVADDAVVGLEETGAELDAVGLPEVGAVLAIAGLGATVYEGVKDLLDPPPEAISNEPQLGI